MSKTTSFWGDQEISMFAGRPPALSQHHQSRALPLAIRSGLEHEADDVPCHATICRMMALAGAIRDGVSGIVGGTRPWARERIAAPTLEAAEIYDPVPMVMRVTKESLLLYASETMWRLLFCRFHRLRIQFHLERGQQSQQKLFEVAREMVGLIVLLWLQRDRWRDRRYGYDCVMMCYGHGHRLGISMGFGEGSTHGAANVGGLLRQSLTLITRNNVLLTT
ncbi:hypothetical protein BJ875DRAFT_123689 [Amylocarpus encephaloides]|uniref:Uncharacterized protein n=1 Tax=Amylocarpus encephaloides TaxID=45428 RepID=A0A9P7YD70_9HELO|nr:hypothetical protein BJ875DRAFT_123689 [Amylocarpus encephaloides]